MKKLMAVVPALVALAIAVPATAKQHPTHPAQSHKCVAHQVSYRAHGTLTAWALTQNTDGRWSGTLTVQVSHTNRHARGDKGSTVTYTVTDARVHFGKNATNPPATGSRVEVIGRVTELGRKCDQTGFTPTVTVHKIIVRAPKSSATTTTTSTTS